MRSWFIAHTLLVVLLATTAAAHQYVHVWKWITPEDEEFTVLMPESNFRIRRELSFGGELKLKPISFEITNRGVLFSVLSFAKSEPATPKALDEFINGFRHAIINNTEGTQAALQFERELTLEGRAGRQFQLKVGDARGSARIYETVKHFYVVLALGGAEVEKASELFQSSFMFDKAGTSRVSERETRDALTEPRKPPSPLWPVVGGTTAFGVRTSGDAEAGKPPSGEAPKSREKIVSGGVINGKALSKPQPAFPPIAKAARAQGTVTVQVLVDEEGYVISAVAISGHPLLQQASVAAARQARFAPMTLEGKPVKVSGVITYNFVLR